MSVKVTRDEVIAFRLQAQNLNRRLNEQSLVAATGVCGVQNSPPGSALLALNARVQGVTSEAVNAAISDDKSLLQSWCMRGAPFYFPTSDLPIFTTGALPPTDDGRRHFVRGVEASLDELGMSLAEVVDRARDTIGSVLSDRRLTVNDLGVEIAEQIAHDLPKNKRASWEREGPYAKGQPLGEGVVHFCLRILTLQNVICFAPRDGNKAPFVLLDEWLAAEVPVMAPEDARAELLRRYLHVYGPSTRGDFASWLGVRSREGEAWWDLLDGEMTEVDFGRRTWVLSEDLDALQSPPTPTGVRLLPPRDPYIQGRDRGTIIDKQFHRDVFKTVGEPGTVLVDGRILGIWRARKKGKNLSMSVTAFDPLSAHAKKSVEAEAEKVASLRGAAAVEVDVDSN
ncbi:MAG: winged helix DNA-binding domain-containing protein [Brevibacterium sp.]|nr:winged helix DNA-binding domain-containing protein [Brevibacterium sp.]